MERGLTDVFVVIKNVFESLILYSVSTRNITFVKLFIVQRSNYGYTALNFLKNVSTFKLNEVVENRYLNNDNLNLKVNVR